MFGSFLQTLITAVVWIVANVVYLDMKRKGLRGFTRFAAFWAGTPTTWITLFAVRERSQPSFERAVDFDGLLEQIRRDRALRSEANEGEVPATGATGERALQTGPVDDETTGTDDEATGTDDEVTGTEGDSTAGPG